MFSYRHGFHAGNHADVIKHMCMINVLDYLKKKEKPFVYFDTHAGAGLYDLNHEWARKTEEFKEGISQLIDGTGKTPCVKRYLEEVATFWSQRLYPGSPVLAEQLLREQDAAVLMEWHNNEVEKLKANFSRNSNVKVHHRDGFEGLVACLPHKIRRGLVLIDPPYEQVEEYQFVNDCIKKSLARWHTGTFAIWYPLLEGEKSGFRRMLEQFKQLSCNGVVDFQLQVRKQGEGMFGSGICVINPPWQLAEQMTEALQEVCPLLAQDDHARVRVNWLVDAQ